MKPRTQGFLAEEKISHDSEAFQYIQELHEYLWRFTRVQYPEAGGSLGEWVDRAVGTAELKAVEGNQLCPPHTYSKGSGVCLACGEGE